MWIVDAVVRVAICVGVSGCYDNEDATLCTASADCRTGGTCLAAPVSRLLYCAEPAPGCATGLRWADSAGDDLSGACVAPDLPADAGVAVDVASTVDVGAEG